MAKDFSKVRLLEDGNFECLVCGVVKSKLGIWSHYTVSHTDEGRKSIQKANQAAIASLDAQKEQCHVCNKIIRYCNFERHKDIHTKKEKYLVTTITCEMCGNLAIPEYKSLRFCTKRCSRSFSTSKNRKETSKKTSETLSGKKRVQHLSQDLVNSCPYCSKGYIKKISLRSHIIMCTSGPNGQKIAIEKELKRTKREAELMTSLFSELKGPLKRERIFKEQNSSCNRCQLSSWLGEKITLELEHKDGNHFNDIRENLELLCPNCHSLTSTWRGRNKNKGRSGKRVSDEALINALKQEPTIRQALIKVGLSAKGGNYFRAKNLKQVMG